jgi:hypothetical protein
MLNRVRNFGATYAERFPETSAAHAAFAAIAAEIARLEALDVAERWASHGRRAARKDAARSVLADSLTRAGFTARVVAKTDPALDARVDLPLPDNDLQLLKVARHFAAAAAPCAAEFAAHGIPVPELERHIAAFDQARHERAAHQEDHVTARAEIKTSFSRAMDAVAVLDVNVANYLASDVVALAVWKYDRRLTRPKRSPGAADAIAPPATTEESTVRPNADRIPRFVAAAQRCIDRARERATRVSREQTITQWLFAFVVAVALSSTAGRDRLADVARTTVRIWPLPG